MIPLKNLYNLYNYNNQGRYKTIPPVNCDVMRVNPGVYAFHSFPIVGNLVVNVDRINFYTITPFEVKYRQAKDFDKISRFHFIRRLDISDLEPYNIDECDCGAKTAETSHAKWCGSLK